MHFDRNRQLVLDTISSPMPSCELSAPSVLDSKSLDHLESPFLSISPIPSFTQIPAIPSTGETSPTMYCAGSAFQNPSSTYDPYITAGSMQEYTLISTFNRGPYGQTMLTSLNKDTTNQLYVVKAISKGALRRYWAREIIEELDIMRFIATAMSSSNKPCPFIQTMREIFQDDDHLFTVLEYHPITLGHPRIASQFRLFQTSSQLTPSSSRAPSPSESRRAHMDDQADTIHCLRLLGAELTLGLLFLHRHGIVHQDIKPANIMVSGAGHVMIGDFGAASMLPILGQITGESAESVDSTYTSKDAIYGCIVLQPEDTVTFTPLYAAPELMERNGNGLLEYDERVDWWSLGVSLYEVVTGGIPFQVSDETASLGQGRRREGEGSLDFYLLDALNLGANAGRSYNAADAQLDTLLRELLVHNSSDRLSGEIIKSHPFFEPICAMWEEVEALRHQPCPVSPTYTFDEQFPWSDTSSLDRRRTRASVSSEIGSEKPYTACHVTPTQENLKFTPLTMTARMNEALTAGRHPAEGLWDHGNDSGFIDSQESASAVLQQDAFISSHFYPSCRLDQSHIALDSTASCSSVVHSLSSDLPYTRCSYETEDDARDHANSEDVFNDSGLDISPGPLWDGRRIVAHRERSCSELLQHPTLRASDVYETDCQEDPAQNLGFHHQVQPVLRGHVAQSDSHGVPGYEWTFDERITISLLQAKAKVRGVTELQIRPRMGKTQLVAAASGRMMKAARRRISDTLRRRDWGVGLVSQSV
ncbi:kinase-like domain-containing protein [Crassisporium funariophilum]|nr:kinase-like domain-containing protein [Crassisporium funariophilum]